MNKKKAFIPITALMAALLLALVAAMTPFVAERDLAYAQTANPQAITPPAAPTWPDNGAVTAVGTQTVELRWTAPTGAVEITGYKIQRSTETPVKWVDVSANTGNKKTYYSDNSSFLAGKSVRYRVAAINSKGVGAYVERAESQAVPLPKDGNEPGMPTGLSATLSETAAGSIELKWSAPDQGENAITGYTVQWSPTRELGKTAWADITGSGTGTERTHTGVSQGTTRYYRVAATNGEGTGPYSAVVSETTRPVGVPAAPSFEGGSTYAVGTQTVELRWVAPTATLPPGGPVAITGYRIQRSTDAGDTWVDASANTGNKNTYYSDTSSSLAGKKVRYRVAGINSVGMGPYVEQTGDNADTTLPKSVTQPDAPTGLTVTGIGVTSDVTLTWNAPSGTVNSYIVQWSPTREFGATNWAQVGSNVTTTTVNDTSIPQGVMRYYRVAAVRTGADPTRGPYSDVVSGVLTGVPTAPTWPDNGAVTAVGTQTVELRWTAPTGAVEITGYKIQRSTETPVKWVDVSANTGNKKTYYSDNSSFLAGKSVRYRVAAINSKGVGAYVERAESQAVPLPKDGNEPGMPTGLSATLSETAAGSIELKWSAPDQGENAITGYTVQWSPTRELGKTAWADITGSGTGTERTHTGVSQGTTRYYRVAATNGEGTGPYSAVVSETTRPVGVPAAPSFAGEGNGTYVVGTQTVEVRWAAPTATLPSGGSVAITGYKIQRSTDEGDTWVDASANTGNKNNYYSDNDSSLAGKKVRYRVAGINSVGMGPYVEQTGDGADKTLPKSGKYPDAPTGLTVTAINLSNVTLTWNAPSGTVSSYIVQWSPTRELGATNWAQVGSDVTTTTVNNQVPQGVTRYYRVAAIRGSGENALRGPYSDVVRVGGAADEPGAVALSTQTPMVGTAITATLTDADGGVSGQSWQWQKSMTPTDATSWMDATGTGAATASYTPDAMDKDYRLRATVSYTDAHGSGKMAQSMATGAVAEAMTLLDIYDANDNDRIDRSEAVQAVTDYLNGDLSRADAVAVILLYLNG